MVIGPSFVPSTGFFLRGSTRFTLKPVFLHCAYVYLLEEMPKKICCLLT